jgi:hypothetical protein
VALQLRVRKLAPLPLWSTLIPAGALAADAGDGTDSARSANITAVTPARPNQRLFQCVVMNPSRSCIIARTGGRVEPTTAREQVRAENAA